MKKQSGVTPADNARWIAAGYGQGSGETYRPWTLVRDVPSHGLSHMVNSLLFDRKYHFLSTLERNHAWIEERDPNTTEIREQVALLPQSETLEIAKDLGVRHPRHDTGVPTVMTTDLIVTAISDASKVTVGKFVKYKEVAETDRYKRIFAIEKEYWSRRDVVLELSTEEGLRRQFVKNLEWLQVGLSDPELLDLKPWSSTFLSSFYSCWSRGDSLGLILKRVERDLECLSGNQLFLLFQWLVWSKRLDVDLDFELQPCRPVVLGGQSK